MTDYTELKRLAEAIHGPGSTMQMLARWRGFENACEPKLILALIAENERLAANVKLNLCDYPAIHSGDVDLLISFVSGTSQIALAEQHQCTPPNISRKIRRVKARLGWKDGMGPMEIRARAEQLRTLASQGAVVTADLMVERDRLKAENEALRKHQPSTEVIWCACGDGHAANSYGAGFMAANNGVCANCDAAMDKGGRS